MSNSNLICPECKTELSEDFLRCPSCHANLLDASPWKCDYNLYAISGSLILWLMFTLARHKFNIPFETVFSDGISNSILLLAVYGIFIIVFKWNLLSRQHNAFRIIRQILTTEFATCNDILSRLRELVKINKLGSFNNLIVYQRLHWIVLAKQLENPAESGILEVLKQHAETDWDSLENSFAITQFLIWLLPTAGFLGTVFGMTQALKSFSEVVARGSDLGFSAGLTATAQGLGVAFHTTLVGLAMVIPLLAFSTFLKRHSHLFLEQIDKYFIRFATEVFIAPVEIQEDQRIIPTEPTISNDSDSIEENEFSEVDENEQENDVDMQL